MLVYMLADAVIARLFLVLLAAGGYETQQKRVSGSA
jgi:hypothetical protein